MRVTVVMKMPAAAVPWTSRSPRTVAKSGANTVATPETANTDQTRNQHALSTDAVGDQPDERRENDSDQK